MLQLIDTHTHLYSEEFSEDREKVINRAREEGVIRFYLPAIDSSQTNSLLDLEAKFPGQMFAMAGLHPCSVKENFLEEIASIQQQLSERKFAAIGETGLDFYWDTTFASQQYENLRIHAEWAIQYKLPLVLHTRNAMQETIGIIREYKGRNLRGIFHCFAGTLENAKEIIDMGFLLGIGGVLTFKNSGLATVVREINLKHLVLETDSPYLAPAPFRGKRNESSYLKFILQKLAEVQQKSIEQVAAQTTQNAITLFGA